MGVDMGSYDSLVAHRLSVEEIRLHVGADTLAYLSHGGMMRALAEAGGMAGPDPSGGFCSACFTGDYPLDIAGVAGKNGFESP